MACWGLHAPSSQTFRPHVITFQSLILEWYTLNAVCGWSARHEETSSTFQRWPTSVHFLMYCQCSQTLFHATSWIFGPPQALASEFCALSARKLAVLFWGLSHPVQSHWKVAAPWSQENGLADCWCTTWVSPTEYATFPRKVKHYFEVCIFVLIDASLWLAYHNSGDGSDQTSLCCASNGLWFMKLY